MTKRFQISTRRSGRLRTVKVHVYDTVEQMRKSSFRYSKRHRLFDVTDSVADIAEAEALAEYVVREKYIKNDPDQQMILLPDAGHIRLHRSRLEAGLISHEITHIAAHIYGDECAEKYGPPWGGNMEGQEILADLIEQLTGQLVDRLYKYGFVGEAS